MKENFNKRKFKYFKEIGGKLLVLSKRPCSAGFLGCDFINFRP
jgi:hypothetical protein